MSIHPTLRGVDTLKGERSVLTRQERLTQLKKAGKFEEEKRSVYGLPKVRTKFKVAGAKKKAKEAAPGAAGAPGAPAAGAAGAKAPAGGAKAPAAGAKAAAAPAAAGKKGDKK
ncbi:MAG: small basic protein [Planctomycetota bacterium]